MKVRHYLTGEIREVIDVQRRLENFKELEFYTTIWIFDDGRLLRMSEMSDWRDWDENAEVTPVTPKS